MRGILAFGALLMAGLPLAARADEGADVDAWLARIEERGWTYLSSSDTTVLFVKKAPAAGQYKRVWVRYEMRPRDSARSTISLVEVDCAQVRDRTLQLTAYPENNLSGAARSFSPDQPEWTYPIPGTFQEIVLEQTCAGK